MEVLRVCLRGIEGVAEKAWATSAMAAIAITAAAVFISCQNLSLYVASKKHQAVLFPVWAWRQPPPAMTERKVSPGRALSQKECCQPGWLLSVGSWRHAWWLR